MLGQLPSALKSNNSSTGVIGNIEIIKSIGKIGIDFATPGS
jgi:hypothetical protein